MKTFAGRRRREKVASGPYVLGGGSAFAAIAHKRCAPLDKVFHGGGGAETAAVVEAEVTAGEIE